MITPVKAPVQDCFCTKEWDEMLGKQCGDKIVKFLKSVGGESSFDLEMDIIRKQQIEAACFAFCEDTKQVTFLRGNTPEDISSLIEIMTGLKKISFLADILRVMFTRDEPFEIQRNFYLIDASINRFLIDLKDENSTEASSSLVKFGAQQFLERMAENFRMCIICQIYFIYRQFDYLYTLMDELIELSKLRCLPIGMLEDGTFLFVSV